MQINNANPSQAASSIPEANSDQGASTSTVTRVANSSEASATTSSPFTCDCAVKWGVVDCLAHRMNENQEDTPVAISPTDLGGYVNAPRLLPQDMQITTVEAGIEDMETGMPEPQSPYAGSSSAASLVLDQEESIDMESGEDQAPYQSSEPAKIPDSASLDADEASGSQDQSTQNIIPNPHSHFHPSFTLSGQRKKLSPENKLNIMNYAIKHYPNLEIKRAWEQVNANYKEAFAGIKTITDEDFYFIPYTTFRDILDNYYGKGALTRMPIVEWKNE